MGKPKGGVNEKVAKANAKKAANQAVKDAQAATQRENEARQEWSKGANNRGAARAEAEASKLEEQRRKREQKAALMAAEEAELAGASGVKKAVGSGQKAKAAGKKKSKKKDNDLSLLEDALVSGADKKAKKAKADKLKREREQAEAQRKKQEAAAAAQEGQYVDPLMANTNAMIGNMDDMDHPDTNGEGALVGRAANRAIAEMGASGIDAALGTLSVSGGKPDAHPEKRMKAAYLEFEEKMLPIVKEEYPGLRLSQYKEKIFAMWKKSPENPMNQQQ
uniref:HMG box domain-containing protein n=1 Tax=Leptocylindrus danicus TaxID=163516 RepID=A0A7S2JXS9_9STRA|mmetsp:Transcript_1396/g.2022  ORF Transcript_1396/g.2022 Transcript_1396/m.2022 type:complete len:277 (+) Transcript_1396:125-955(+)|eukprot:CAMPEP_0116031258 /NCGR_PEP_ID=MMETSP0321-20121206/17397_1 /TAXON_ID=163516 /ORGANISM="Leptocylindrus danicus var. danicus, Strain B650" /LENGTH=276 /DNA_ID=CAMNT_0003506329 /DNA_START=31 /DNA_END=861 /DNA_ORIENTATION=-